jgi:class 3 adenylate cyclase
LDRRAFAGHYGRSARAATPNPHEKFVRAIIRIRIGLNCAIVLVGNVGSSAQLSYGVNVAARLEGMVGD